MADTAVVICPERITLVVMISRQITTHEEIKMRANPVNAYLFVWSAWLVLVVVIAYLRHKQVQPEKQERRSRRQKREAHVESQVREVEREPAQPRIVRPRRKLGAEYRQQLIDAGILKPAEPEQSV